MTRVHLRRAQRSRPITNSANRSRRYDLLFARQRLAYEITDESANDNVFAELGNFSVEQVVNCDVRIFDEALLEQANRAIEFLELAFHNFVRYVGGLALHLRLVDLALGFNEIAGNVSLADVQRMSRGDMQRDVFNKLPEILVSGDKIGFTIDLDEHTDFSLQMNVGGDDAFLCRTRRLFRGARDTFGAQDRFSFFEIASTLDKSALAVHETGIGFFAELLNELGIDL